MKRKLEKKLCRKFPKIFRQINLPMSETCMCWGFECDDGWYDTIYNLCKKIQNYVDDNDLVEQIEAVQVKEKYGTLRFYTNYYDDTIEDFIDEAEKITEKICQGCGTDQNVSQSTGYWISFYCDKCNEADVRRKRIQKSWSKHSKFSWLKRSKIGRKSLNILLHYIVK